ncbi:hypothetical protein MJO28_008315 [Puccinia striiformis f. sp. tritici]|uniref:Uncharacterized protein n=1 Tax=Puccinia striiformis f. sp. tritici TaxID=168172 RepID=A0ACC0EAJ9_9BASI|nr:hypothetical protein MJO28_008315 [Puccinia striiformis f. sp. tritici]KAI7952594.1 hypothetical protein MJO29_008225 [Puccinia striiformis f. sp. tritici]
MSQPANCIVMANSRQCQSRAKAAAMGKPPIPPTQTKPKPKPKPPTPQFNNKMDHQKLSTRFQEQLKNFTLYQQEKKAQFKPDQPPTPVTTTSPTIKSRDPPPIHATESQKKMTAARKKYNSYYIIDRSPSDHTKKRVLLLPNLNKLTKNAIMSAGNAPLFFLEGHSFTTQPSSPTSLYLSNLISDLSRIAQVQHNGQTHLNQLNSNFHLLGFNSGNDLKISADDHQKLDNHNTFITSRINTLWEAAYTENTQLMTKKGTPNWIQLKS